MRREAGPCAGALALIALLAVHPATAEVPLSYAASGHATVPVAIGRAAPVGLVLDTGAEGTALYAAHARVLGLEPVSRGGEELVGQTGTLPIPFVRLPALVLDGRTVQGIEAAVLPDRADGVPLAGIVGADVLARFLVEIDFPRRRFALHDAGTAPAALLGPGAKSVAVTLDAARFVRLPVRVDAEMAVAVLDTGARRTRINWKLATGLGLNATSPSLRDGEPIQGATNNPVATKEGVIGDVVIGGYGVRGAEALIVDLPVFEVFGVADEPAMILGLDLLQGARLLVDYRGSRLWLEPAPSGGR